MKSVFIFFSIVLAISLTTNVSSSFSDPILTDTINISHINQSSSTSGNLVTKNFDVLLQNISDNQLHNVEITASYFAGSSLDTVPVITFGDVFAGDAIETEESISVVIDQSQLPDGLYIFTWQVEYDNFEGDHIVDEFLVEDFE